jgi:Protein of unknown function (DUF3717)
VWCEEVSWHHVGRQRQISLYHPMLYVTIQELEAAINYWRSQSPAEGEELRLCAEASVLAKPYALMIVQGAQRVPVDVLDELARSAIQKFIKISQAT